MRERATHELLQRAELIQRLVAVHAAQLASHRIGNGLRRHSRPNRDRHDRREEVQQPIGDLRQRIVDLILNARLIVCAQSPVPDVADHADDLNRGRTDCRNPELLSDDVVTAEGMPREVFVHDDDRVASKPIVIVDESPVTKRDSHHARITRE